MSIALDFGTSNTVFARWNDGLEDVETPHIDGLSKRYIYKHPDNGEERTANVIPSLIHYGEGDNISIGARVESAGLVQHRGTFRWVKMDLLRNRKGGRRINGRRIDNFQAASDLLSRILLFAEGHLGAGDKDLILTAPVEAYDDYVDWLREAAYKTAPFSIQVIDEATACILGYKKSVRNDEVYVIFDFGGGTLDISVVRVDLEAEGQRKCRILGRKGEEIGGMLIDQWLLEDLAQKKSLSTQDLEDVGTALLHSVEDAKIRLCSGDNEVEISQFNDLSGRLISHNFEPGVLRNILTQHGVYQTVSLTVEKALEQANERYGTHKSEIRGVFMVGGSSLLLEIKDLIQNLFPGRPLYFDNPFEAVARGACRYAGEDLSAALVHDYCLNSWNRNLKTYELKVIVPKGTQYPTEKPVCGKYINAACEGASTLGLVIIERSEMRRPEIIYEDDGSGLRAVETVNKEDINVRELNPEHREFIHANPPCERGDRRFVAAFGVDANKRLTLSLKDLEEGNRSFVRLSDNTDIPLPVKDLPVVRL
jgi:molecular chaperone DnaK